MRPQNINNLNTEKDGIKLLRRKIDKFFVPSIQERRFLYDISGIDYKQYSDEEKCFIKCFIEIVFYRERTATQKTEAELTKLSSPWKER